MDSPELQQAITKRYDFEHDKREKINGRLPHLTTLFIAICGIGAYLIPKLQQTENRIFSIVLWAAFGLLFLAFVYATFHAYVALRGYEYGYLMRTKELKEYMDRYEQTLQAPEFDDVRIEYYRDELNSLILEQSIKCADHNSEVNETRSISLSVSIASYSVIGFVAIFLVGLISITANFEAQKANQSVYVSCVSCEKSVYSSDTVKRAISGSANLNQYTNTEKLMSSQEAKQDKPQPPPPPVLKRPDPIFHKDAPSTGGKK